MTDPRYEVLRVAMRKIAWPMLALHEYADSIGHDFEPVIARELSNDPSFLKEIALRALADIVSIDPTGVNDPPAQPSEAKYD